MTQILSCRRKNFNKAGTCFDIVQFKKIPWPIRESEKSKVLQSTNSQESYQLQLVKRRSLLSSPLRNQKASEKKNILSIRLDLNNFWLFFIKKFTQTSDQVLLSEIVNLHLSEFLKNLQIASVFSPFAVELKTITMSDTILCSMQDPVFKQHLFSNFLNFTCFILFFVGFIGFIGSVGGGGGLRLIFIESSCSCNHFVSLIIQNQLLISFLILFDLHLLIPKQIIFSVLSAEVNWSLEFWPESVLLEVRDVSTQRVVNSIELPSSVWNLLGSQRLRFMEEALTGAAITQEQQQRLYEVHENLEVPWVQDPIREWEGQEVVVDNFSTPDSGAATLSPMRTSWNDTTGNSSNIFKLAVNRYGFN